MMTEGTYPHSFGGVSVWCDQLVRGLDEHRFQIIALVGTGVEKTAWELPVNVDSVQAILLWGNPPVGRKPGRRARQNFRVIFRSLIDVLLSGTANVQPIFGRTLRDLYNFALYEDLDAAMRSEDAVGVLTAAWQQRGWTTQAAVPSVLDALRALQLLNSSLRPLSHTSAQAELSHCVTNGIAVLPALTAKWLNGTPFILTEHGIYLRERYICYRASTFRWAIKELQLAFLRHLCSLAYTEAAVIAPGNVYNKRWEERLGASPAMIRTIYNGVEPDDFPAVEGEPDIPTISWAGRIDPIKDLETLIRAFALVLADVPDCRLRLFGGVAKGGEDYLQRCKDLAGELGVAAAVTFEGRVDVIRDAYVAGRVVVLSSISEGFPYTLIEAMTCGRACVATDVGGVSEALADTGYVVPPRDPEAMARACATLLQDAELRRRLGSEARARVLELFTVDRAVSAFNELYYAVAEGRPIPAASVQCAGSARPGGPARFGAVG